MDASFPLVRMEARFASDRYSYPNEYPSLPGASWGLYPCVSELFPLLYIRGDTVWGMAHTTFLKWWQP